MSRARSFVIVAAIACAMAACGPRPARLVVWAYLNQPECAKRAAFILDAPKNTSLMMDVLKDHLVSTCAVEHHGIDEGTCSSIAQDEYCTVTANGVAPPFEVKRTAEGFKIDFRATHGVGPQTIAKTMTASLRGAVVRVTAVRVAGADATVKLAEDGGKTSVTAQVHPKARADLFRVLGDGKEHKVMLTVGRSSLEGRELQVLRFVQEGWRQRDDEEGLASMANADLAAAEMEARARQDKNNAERDAANRVLSTIRPRLNACLGQGRARGTLQGDVDLKIAIDRTGKIASIEDASTLNDKATVECVVAAVKTLSFPPTPNGTSTGLKIGIRN